MAAIAAVSGRLAEAERFAEGAVNILTKSFAPEDVVLLRPLQILAAARFEQGETAKAKAAFQKIRLIPIDRPEDVAVVHGMAGIFLHSEGKSQEAESEYLAAIHAWEQAGRGELSDAGSDLMALASLYVKERRLDDAQRTLDRAAVIFAHAQDAVPMDRVKLLNVRAALHTRKGEWREAEQDLREAVSLADDDPRLSPVSLGYVLNNYAQVLRKNHRGREAREIEARVAALGSGSARRAVVDVSELLAKPKSAK
jgi:tetratricopeptide (TPR) repeat protein